MFLVEKGPSPSRLAPCHPLPALSPQVTFLPGAGRIFPEGRGFGSTAKLPVSTKAFPRSGEGGCDRREQTNEGAPADGANGYSPLIRHFVPPSTPRGEGISGNCQLCRTAKKLPPRESCRADARLRGWSVASHYPLAPYLSSLKICKIFCRLSTVRRSSSSPTSACIRA